MPAARLSFLLLTVCPTYILAMVKTKKGRVRTSEKALV